MDSLIFELQIVFYFQLFLSANVRHSTWSNENNKNELKPTYIWGVLYFVFTTTFFFLSFPFRQMTIFKLEDYIQF